MAKPFQFFRKALFLAMALLLVSGVPSGVALADSEPCTPPSPTQNGVRWPTGSDAGTFTYQCEGPYAGKWTNSYYLYDPVSNSRIALYSPNYSYDCAAKQWYETRWDFSAAQGSYFQSTIATSDPGGMPTNCPPPPTPTSSSSPGSGTSALNSEGSNSSDTSTGTSSGTSNPSGSGASGTSNSTVGIANGTNATMHNGVISFANTGDALVNANTTGGSADSGDARVIANIINLLQSSSNILGDPNLLTFTADINGDVYGDLLLDPSQLGSIQPANSSGSVDNNVAVNNSTDAAIANDISLGANSGNAGVTDNTSAGNATSGTADAVANVVNVLNSAITAGQSFLGVININGSLNGDILLPPNFVDTLLASNVPRYTLTEADINNTLNVNNNTNQSIGNSVNTTADSGNATVNNNTAAGSALTGAARTNLTVFNLTGSNVVASNNLLVFVNVLGSWYGLIMNAPTGTTAASLGGGVTTNEQFIGNNALLDNDTEQSITNNINVASQSGDASVTGNTKAGNATSGDATASVNLMNMINNSLSLNGWFGLLFINVFGSWNGSFGMNTSAGDPIVSPALATPGESGSSPVQLFRFAPKNTTTNSANYSGGYSNSDSLATQETGSVLGLNDFRSSLASANTEQSPSGTDAARPNLSAILIGSGLALAILLFSERQRFLPKRQHLA